jgi:hypothetical protein
MKGERTRKCEKEEEEIPPRNQFLFYFFLPLLFIVTLESRSAEKNKTFQVNIVKVHLRAPFARQK